MVVRTFVEDFSEDIPDKCDTFAGRSHVFDVVGLDVGGVRARLEPLGVDVHEEVPRDVHQVEVVGVLHPRRVVAAQRELHVEPDLAGVLHLVGVEEDLGRKRLGEHKLRNFCNVGRELVFWREAAA